ncbi:TolC family protein [Motiliproteus sp. MSK22-1]|uniref:TolC family protein n=1 Tax=Motiliproteus sp. MSK22-1 TaxID=1897630 RepID=UPI000976C40F|nr:TolC family protein [Motiliproteus sp. MSK22-1]OMH25536.1 hypothetical protein BGP75_23530 [Motiliproteus sp. MSK22-1]
MRKTKTQILAALLCLLFSLPSQAAAEYFKRLTLDQAITTALRNNRIRMVSHYEIAIAEEQYQQALSAYWPSLSLQAQLQRKDEDTTYSFPGLQAAIPTPAGNLTTRVPESQMILAGRDLGTASLNLTYPIYTGGQRNSLRKQARFGVDIAKAGARRADLQVIYDTRRYYYAGILTAKLRDLAWEHLNSLKVTRDLTYALYQGGSLKANKIDYLRTEIAVSVAESFHTEFSARHKATLAALSQSMGIHWDTELTLASKQFPQHAAKSTTLEQAINDAMRFNPDNEILHLAVKVNEAGIEEARSSFSPKIALTSSINYLESSFDGGVTNGTNRNSWTLGIALNMPLFDGFSSRHKESAARAKHTRSQEQKLLLEQGLAAQVKSLLLEIDRANKLSDIGAKGADFAADNRRLSVMAYQQNTVPVDDMIEAHLQEAIMKSNLFRAQHDQLLYTANLDFVLGGQLLNNGVYPR